MSFQERKEQEREQHRRHNSNSPPVTAADAIVPPLRSEGRGCSSQQKTGSTKSRLADVGGTLSGGCVQCFRYRAGNAAPIQ